MLIEYRLYRRVMSTGTWVLWKTFRRPLGHGDNVCPNRSKELDAFMRGKYLKRFEENDS